MIQMLIDLCLRRSGRILFVICLSTQFTIAIEAQATRRNIPGRRGVIIDERLSAVRAAPDLKARLVQRPGRGRRIGILGSIRTKSGERYYKVAISKNRRGWILQDAVARSGNAADGEKLLNLIAVKADDFSRAALARLCADEFPRTTVAPKCLLLLAEAADRAAVRLSRDAFRRLDSEGISSDDRRKLLLNYSGLDRYNRLGILFDYDEEEEMLVYDGAAYRELLRRYPRSPEARMRASYFFSGRRPKFAAR